MRQEIHSTVVDFDEQYEETVLTAFDIEADEVTEIIEIDPTQMGASTAPRVSFMSSLFRAL